MTDSKTYEGALRVHRDADSSLRFTDTANFTQAFNTKDVGTGKTITPGGTVNDSNSGNNYTYTFTRYPPARSRRGR